MADNDDPAHGGGIHDDLREQHAKELTSEHDLFGWAIGGLSVGKDEADMMRALASTTTHMPEHKPRYLMGVGTSEDLLDGISLDVDMFDCVMLTRNAKINGVYLERQLTTKSYRHTEDDGPMDHDYSCYT